MNRFQPGEAGTKTACCSGKWMWKVKGSRGFAMRMGKKARIVQTFSELIAQLIPGGAALVLLCSPTVRGQAVVRETAAATSAPTEVAGTLAEWRPFGVIILTKETAEPLHFSFAKKVGYVDAAGKPVGRDVITPGVPVTMRYVREGDRMLVDRVIVQRPLAAEVKAAASTETPVPKTALKADIGYEVKAIDKIRGSIEQEERQLSGHSR